MNEYEKNKVKIQAYKDQSSGTRLMMLLCQMMEWINEHCLKSEEAE